MNAFYHSNNSNPSKFFLEKNRLHKFALCLLIFFLYSFGQNAVYAQCTGSEQRVNLYQTYGIDYSGELNTINPQYALGYPDLRFARLSSGATAAERGSITIELDHLAEYLDTIWIRATAAGIIAVSDLRVRSSFNGTTFSYTENYTTSLDKSQDLLPYVVQNPVGVKYVLIECTDWTQDLLLESIRYKVKDCIEYCVPNNIVYSSGFGDAISINSTSTNSSEALGVPDAVGAQVDGSINGELIIDLGDTIPYQSNIVLYVANSGTLTPFVVTSALEEPHFGVSKAFNAIQEEDAYTPVIYPVTIKTGIRFIKLQVYEDFLTLHVDAVQYFYPDLFGSAAISGTAFNDVNGNTMVNFGEPLVDSALISLFIDANDNNVVDVFDELVATTLTDSVGNYTFQIDNFDEQYLVKIDRASLPYYVTMTTPVQASFSGLGINESYCLNFGFQECLASCPIVAEDDKYVVETNGSVSFRVLANDIGPVDSTTVSILAAGQPQNGAVSVLANGRINYVPNPYYAGIDSFQYIVCSNDIVGDCDTSFVLVEVYCLDQIGQHIVSGIIFDDANSNGKSEPGENWTLPSNIKIFLRSDLNGNGVVDAFDIKIDSVLTAGDGTYSFSIADPAANYILQADITSGPANLGFTTPLTRKIGPFSGFTEKCGNNFGLTFCGPLCPPLAIPDVGTISSGVAKFINLLENDLDFDFNLNPLSLQILTPPSNGNVVLGRDGWVVYYSDANYVGSDQFTYQICDQTAPTPLCSSTTVDLTVTPGFDDPCAEAIRTHTYYLPYPENELRTALRNSADWWCIDLINNVARSITTIKSPYPGVKIYYDHWEDGFEANILSPQQNTSLVWGDEDLSNGVAPGYPNDFIPAGGSIILDNNVFFNPRDPNDITFDGKDKLFTTGDVAISKIVGEIDQINVQAAKTDVYDTERFGTSFIVPFGEDLNNEFRYTSLFIRAESDNTEVLVDKDNDGYAEETEVLNEGEVFFVDGGVESGATISANKRVGVDVLFGGIDCFGTRQVNLMPGKFHSHIYYSPTPSTLWSAPAAVYLNNNKSTSLTVVWTSQFNTGNIVIPARSTVKFFLNDDSGYKFEAPSGETFTAIEVIDSDADGSAYDWAFNLISHRRLSSFASVAWAPGSQDGSGNYNPIWVTPTESTTIYIKHNGDITTPTEQTSPCGLPFDDLVVLDELEYHRIFDNEDNQQNGTALYTCDEVTFVAVYGEDPSAGGPTPASAPAMDVGTTIQPMCLNPLIIANDDYEVAQPSDFVIIAVADNDNGFLTDIDVTSVLTTGLRQPDFGEIEIYDNGSILYTPFPGWEGVDTFEYSICSNDFPGLCDVAMVVVTVQQCVATSVENLVNGLVYLERLPDDGEFNEEDRIPGIIVHLIGDTDCDGIADPSELIIESAVTDASGAYSFTTINGEYVRDEFDDADNPYSGNYGSISWSNAWQEIGVSNGFDNSTVTIERDAFFPTNALVLNGTNDGASRTVNAVDAKQSSLKFSYRRQGLEGTGEELRVRINNNTVYTIEDGNGINTDYFYKDVAVDIPIAFIDPNGPNTVSFITNGSVSSTDYFYIDNVEFIFNQDSVCFVTKVDVADKNGSYLVGSDSTASAVFGSDLGECVNENELAILANYIVRDDYSTGLIDNPQAIRVLENDFGSPHLPSLSTSGLTQPNNGSINILAGGIINYTPDPGYEGVDSFEYAICSEEDFVVCDQGWVFVSVSCLEMADSNIISGSIFTDYNSNGVFDVGERLFDGTSVLLFEDVNGNGVLDPAESLDTIAKSPVGVGNYQFILPPKISTQSSTFTLQLGVEDGRETNSGSVNVGSDHLNFNNQNRWAGFRFANIPIPKYSIITTANLRLIASNNAGNYGHIGISIESTDNAPAFSSSNRNISNRWNGSNAVNWYDVPATIDGSVLTSPNIAELIQSIVDRPNWNIGNNLALVLRRWSGSRRFYSYDAHPSVAAELDISFAAYNYPVRYIAVLDTSSFTSNLSATTAPSIMVTFDLPGETVCRNNFGIYRNSTQAINDVNKTIALRQTNGNVLSNDFDIEGDNHTFTAFLNQNDNTTPIASGATLSGFQLGGGINMNAGVLNFNLDGKGNYSFIPSPGFIGDVVVYYEKCDDNINQACSIARLNIGVIQESNPYDITYNKMISVDDHNVSYGEQIIGNLLSNDSDPEKDIYTLSQYQYDSDGNGSSDRVGVFGVEEIVSGINSFGIPVASAGRITIFADGFYQFTPFNGFDGDIMLDYRVCDNVQPPNSACDDANLFIKVIIDNVPANSPPFAGDDFVVTAMNTPITSDWVSNDGDPDNDLIRILNVPTDIDPLNLGDNNLLAILTTEENGSVEFYEDGLYSYYPPTDFTGPDNVKYSICDVAVGSQCDTATIYFLIDPVGFDYGDLSPTHSFAGNFLAADADKDGRPDHAEATWLGEFVDTEAEFIYSDSADGDNLFGIDDEDGLIFPPNIVYGEENIFKVIVSGNGSASEVHVGLWFDWNNDGEFDDFFKFQKDLQDPDQRRPAAFTDTTVMNLVVPPLPPGQFAAVRLRNSSFPLDFDDFAGVLTSGEVEDYSWRLGDGSILPVELIDFYGYTVNEKNYLFWNTASEINNEKFEIERSADGVSFTKIGEVAGHGTSTRTQAYEFIDHSPFKGNNYYRLKQMDYDGKFEYSHIIRLNLKDEREFANVKIYPNPVQNMLSIDFSSNKFHNRYVDLVVTNMAGEQVIKHKIDTKDVNSFSYNFGELANGSYLVEIKDKYEIISEKIIKF